jgi:hypothetical protein
MDLSPEDELDVKNARYEIFFEGRWLPVTYIPENAIDADGDIGCCVAFVGGGVYPWAVFTRDHAPQALQTIRERRPSPLN